MSTKIRSKATIFLRMPKCVSILAPQIKHLRQKHAFVRSQTLNSCRKEKRRLFGRLFKNEFYCSFVSGFVLNFPQLKQKKIRKIKTNGGIEILKLRYVAIPYANVITKDKATLAKNRFHLFSIYFFKMHSPYFGSFLFLVFSNSTVASQR